MKKIEEKIYDEKIAKKYFNVFQEPSDFLSTFLELMQNTTKERKILDVGCGTGINANFVTTKNFIVTGIDISEEMLKIARNNFQHINFYLQDFKKLKTCRDEFDGIIASYFLIHIQKNEVYMIMRKFYAILKEEGCVYLSLHLGESKEVYLNRLLGCDITPLFLNIMTFEEISEIIKEANFKIIFKKVRKAKNNEIKYKKMFLIIKKERKRNGFRFK